MAFTDEELGEGWHHYQEAIEHPLTNRWQVQEVWTRPNDIALNVDAKFIVEVKPIAQATDLSLEDAIAHLGTFEAANKSMGMTPYGEQADQLGDEHVVKFAALNNYALDIHMKPHPSHRGRIVTRGYFTPEVRQLVLEQYNRPASDKPYVTDSDLSHLFNAAAEVEDFERLLSRKEDLAKWETFRKSVGKYLKEMLYCQREGFQPVERSAAGGFMKVHTFANEADYTEAKKKALEALGKLDFLSKEDRVGKYSRFFDEVQLVMEVAHAKALYRRFENAGNGNKDALSKEVKAQTAEAVRLSRQLGGSERDAKRINAEIVENKSINLRDTYKGSGNEVLMSRYDIDGYSDVYFFPETILQFLKSLDETTEAMQKAVENEKKRIVTAPAPGTSSQAADAGSAAARGARRPGLGDI